MSHTTVTSPLDLSDELPLLALGLDCRRPLLFYVRQCISDGFVWTTVGIANSAYWRGLISIGTAIVACVLASGASYLIAGGTSAKKPSTRP